jgi:hypothetical protein
MRGIFDRVWGPKINGNGKRRAGPAVNSVASIAHSPNAIPGLLKKKSAFPEIYRTFHSKALSCLGYCREAMGFTVATGSMKM